jgi:CIC family chloride channel protein
MGWLSVVLVPALGGLIAGPIIMRFAREAKGHGVPEVMAAMIQRGGFIRPRVALVKAASPAPCLANR